MSAEAIAKVREMFEAELAKNADAYHPVDIERVRNEEWQVKRFLLASKDNVDEAFAALCQALQWKKTFGLHDRPDSFYPKEIWELNGIEICGRDKENHLVQWEVYRNQRSFKEANLLARQFIAHTIERADRAAGEDGFVLVMDVGGAGISNIDMDQIKFKLQTIELYPSALRAMYVVDLPWILNPIMKVIVSFMSPHIKAIMKYVNRKELIQLIDPQYVMAELGGKRDKRVIPNELLPLDQLSRQLNFDEKFVDHFYNTYKLKRTNK